MIADPEYGVDDWSIREHRLPLDRLAQTESIFALGNGHIGLRGNLDEGEPHGLPGTYLDGFHESHPVPYAEAGYGYPEAGQTVVNVTNGKLIRLLVNDEQWQSPGHRAIRIRTTRMVSLVQRAMIGIEYQVEVSLPLHG